jgi:hypothetical protein
LLDDEEVGFDLIDCHAPLPCVLHDLEALEDAEGGFQSVRLERDPNSIQNGNARNSAEQKRRAAGSSNIAWPKSGKTIRSVPQSFGRPRKSSRRMLKIKRNRSTSPR